ncbi:MAG: hypothetical protein ABJM06_09500 [Gilvibacter sp.]
MKILNSYLQYAAGHDIENVTTAHLDKALTDLPKMDDEHGAFWVGVYGDDTDEFVLEIDKELSLTGIFGEEVYKIQLNHLAEARGYYELLLGGKIDELKEQLKNH